MGGVRRSFKVIVFDKPFINIVIKAGGTKADLSNITVLITHPSKPNGKNNINNREYKTGPRRVMRTSPFLKECF